MKMLVRELRLEAERVFSVTLEEPEGRELPAWEPGSHIDLKLPNGLVRQYSLCGVLGDRRRWRIGVLDEEGSRGGSRYITRTLRPGDVVEVSAVRNNFDLLEAPAYCFIAGGIGITPILPMVGQVADRGAPWRLVYGGRRLNSMAFVSELARYGDRIDILAEDVGGLPDLGQLIGGCEPGTAVYCCGPEGLIVAVEAAVSSRPDVELHIERFVPRQPSSAAKPASESFTVELRRSGIEVTVPADQPILDVLEEAGIDVPNSCREGICGSCETPVLAGEVDHRDSVLSASERATNSTMMICVSRCTSDRLVLDL